MFDWLKIRLLRRSRNVAETRVVPIPCKHVWREISNYIEDDIDAELRARMEQHFKECRHCLAVLEGSQNVIRLVGDGEVFEVPAGFSERLHGTLAARIEADQG
ncbi:MAG: anti-sigma factor family protein [Acidobacteriaceae bacterium]